MLLALDLFAVRTVLGRDLGFPLFIQPGKILYEIEGVSEELAREAFALAAAKLPVKTTIVTRTVM